MGNPRACSRMWVLLLVWVWPRGWCEARLAWQAWQVKDRQSKKVDDGHRDIDIASLRGERKLGATEGIAGGSSANWRRRGGSLHSSQGR
ncbi:hypothetical protein B0T11DRAFT_274084 [Plectosphaerella cucumerina]|uniref:Secreted protein n=1 Tax=Plectosphaerella cucumerina TaxID=40658 RepID=A0A8K0TLM2_9PEZI|nr:hypothetical protein B0T11DRAFT_274084 [Plectosphaerella cucumerina]